MHGKFTAEGIPIELSEKEKKEDKQAILSNEEERDSTIEVNKDEIN